MRRLQSLCQNLTIETDLSTNVNRYLENNQTYCLLHVMQYFEKYLDFQYKIETVDLSAIQIVVTDL